MNLPVSPPVAPMLAKPVAAIPPGQLYEPKWDGFRSIVFRDGDEVEIEPQGAADDALLPRGGRGRPAPPAGALRDRRRDRGRRRGGLDFWALQQRIHPPPAG